MSGSSGLTRRVRRRAAELDRVVRQDGAGQALRLSLRLVGRLLWMGPAHLLEAISDRRLGGRTRGVLHNEDSLRLQSVGGDSNYYEPVRVRKFRRSVACVDLEPASSTFLDLGAGRGRAMLLAAGAGFARVVGVELDPTLAAEAERNVNRWRNSRAGRSGGPVLSVLHEDAGEVTVPDGPLLVFLYNSFGPTTLRRVLDRMIDSHRSAPRPMWLCYLNAQHSSVVEEYPALVPRGRADDWVVYAVEEHSRPEETRRVGRHRVNGSSSRPVAESTTPMTIS